VPGVKVTAKEADGNLTITVRRTGLCRLRRFFVALFHKHEGIAKGKYDAAFKGRRVRG
jgi:hypothetical protein